MGKLIDADALLESLKYSHTACVKWAKDAKDEFVKLRAEQAQVTFAECILRVKGMPEAVVRCKDCEWYEIDQLKKDGTDDRRYKPSVCTLYECRQEPDYFCGDGERKEKTDE